MPAPERIVLQVETTTDDPTEEFLVTSLPGQPKVSFKQYAGYINIDEDHDRELFFYFVEAETDPASKPLVLWLTGGPGCSSVGVAFFEHGPFRTQGKTIVKNDYSWNKEANMLYLDSPAGVGFSYSKNSFFYNELNDELTARDNVKFLSRWFVPFSKYKKHDFYIAGESYGGHYVPQLADILVKEKWNLKGIALGNPLLDFDTDFNAPDIFLWSHSMISDDTYHLKNTVCNSSRLIRESITGSLSSECQYVSNITDQQISNKTSKFDVSADVCLQSQADVLVKKSRKGKDVCAQEETIKYFNQEDVQTAFHAKLVDADSWELCGRVSQTYDALDREIPIVGIVGELVQSGVRVLAYSGDQDGVVPFIGTRHLIKNLASSLKLKTSVEYRAWIETEQVGGWTEVYGDNELSFATIRGGSHTPAENQPERLLVLFQAFVSGNVLPSQ
ncbi:serine carboxypeptidase-like 45 [Rutidosis leptorrhynchoides]|uniref:serine carboxypeptidase-like 45 n=1 Tax=Rutidosis leptorrhynchoides TaxID=125765 RepID=UPI003A99591C